MEKLNLSARLALVASLVEKGSVVADVGTDHGYIPIWLLQNGVISQAIATDIHAGPLDRAKQMSAEYGVSDKIKLLLCDGLAAVAPHEADTVTIAGMGGETIAGILEAAPWTKEGTRLIIQPQSKQPVLRRWLCENGYAIEREFIVHDAGKTYNVLTASGGKMEVPSVAELYVGCAHMHEDKQLLRDYLEHERAKLLQICEKLADSAKNEDKIRRTEYLEAAEGMQRMLEEI